MVVVVVDVWVDSVVGVIDVEGVVFRELVFYVGGPPQLITGQKRPPAYL